jgi:hypothetical protein
MGLRLSISCFYFLAAAGATLACGQGERVVQKDFPDDPGIFGKSTEFNYVSGRELYLLPAEKNWSFTYYGSHRGNLDFCATVRSVEANDRSYAGLMFWQKDNSNFTVLVTRPDNLVVVEKMVAGEWQDQTAHYDLPSSPGSTSQSTQLEVQLAGNEATFFADGVKLGSTRDPSASNEGGGYGYLAGSGAKRSIFAFADPSITSGAEPVPPDGQTAVAASASGDPDLDDVHAAIYHGLLADGLGKSVPDGFSQSSIYGNAQSPFGVPEVLVDLNGSGMTAEFGYRFFKSKDLAAAYIGNDVKQPYIDEFTQPGVLVNFGWRHAKGDFDFPFVSGADPQKGQQWVRAIAQVDSLIMMVTINKDHPKIRMDAKLDEALVAKSGEMLSNAVDAAREAGMHFAFSNAGNDTTPEPNPPKP